MQLSFGGTFTYNLSPLKEPLKSRAQQVIDTYNDPVFHADDGREVGFEFVDPDWVRISVYDEGRPDKPYGGMRLSIKNFLANPGAMKTMLNYLLKKDRNP